MASRIPVVAVLNSNDDMVELLRLSLEQVGLVAEVRLLNGRTIYSQIGDVIAYVAMALTVIALVAVRPRTRNADQRTKQKP